MARAMKSVIWHVYVFLSFLQIITVVKCKGNLIVLNEDNWTDILNGEWMVEFFAPWCPACKALDPVWKDFASWSEDLGIHVGQIDVTVNPGLSGRFMVTALPTIYHVKDGIFRQYRSSRDKDSLMNFIEEEKWKSLDTVSSWKAPQSIQMSIVSYFFKISMTLRTVHNKIVDEYGIPYWGSYIIFALATIVIGALLGLIIVCMIDLMFPAKAPMMPVPDTSQRESSEKEDEKSEEENGDDDNDESENDDEDDIRDDTKDDVKDKVRDAKLGDQELRKRKTEDKSED
ncbi:thioredoxin-related transmembrane protein 1-like [Centruroides vittatus]|uniref:thioredoxin-related transmembrane protein 1-like n=1 Tax=Centruroides vittatus TaxID=120091 RepID=UPI003510515B